MQVSLYNDIFILDDGEVREFLFLSRTTALLIDTGFPGTHIIDVVRRITSLPITVLLTMEMEIIEEAYVILKNVMFMKETRI